MSLEGKAALITGSSRGIGRAIALALARKGASIAINYVRKRQQAEETAHELEQLGVRAATIKANVGDADQVGALVDETVRQLGSVDIFIGNAASGVLKSAIEQDARSWEWTMNINARSILLGARAAAPHMMEKKWGRVLGISSIGSTRVLPEYSIVGVSKAAIETIIRYLAVELAPHGIACNTISPGVVETDALDSFPSKDEMLHWAQQRTPAGRLVVPEEVGELAAFLCSDAASMIVGQTIVIDGGYAVLA